MKRFFLWTGILFLTLSVWAGSLILNNGKKKTGFVTQRGSVFTVFTKNGRLFQYLKTDIKKVIKVDKKIIPGEEEKKISAETEENPIVSVKTDVGDFAIELYEDVAPNTVANFISLVEKGFYDGTIFHRVIPDFVAQGGDPNTKGKRGKDYLLQEDIIKLKRQGKKVPDLPVAGTGGPGYRIKAEFNSLPHQRGTVAMARSQSPDSAGSQFYICFKPQPHLDGKYTVFGKVMGDGMEVVDKIKVGTKIIKMEVVRKRNHPYIPQVIK